MLNLIKLVIDRAIERIVSLISREEVTRDAAHLVAGNIDTDALVDDIVQHERVVREFHNLTSRMVARHVDLGDLAGEIDLTDLAGNLDAADVAGNIDLGDLAGEIDLGDFAESLDYERLAAALDVDLLSDAVYTRVCVPEVEGLEQRINEATAQAVANALDVANRRTEPVAPVVEQSPDLIARLLDLAVEKLLARADEAAKNGEV
jgi:hypothetical protein